MFGTKRKQAGRNGKKAEKPGIIEPSEECGIKNGAKEALSEKNEKVAPNEKFGAVFGTRDQIIQPPAQTTLPTISRLSKRSTGTRTGL